MITRTPWRALLIGGVLVVAGHHDGLPTVELVGRLVVATSWTILWFRACLLLNDAPERATPSWHCHAAAGTVLASLVYVVGSLWIHGMAMTGLLVVALPMCWVAHRWGKHAGFHQQAARATTAPSDT